ncbi:hypothetical protein E2C01_061499 [Portunus trituberculatus]|uniref:Uncharacterized protein n=1 Tax=Portunus trituberculatus TaxID=210409 RepID=A0A5B7HCK1_PORTR|nr:hypothetical protein [Portunus trituberculatus]
MAQNELSKHMLGLCVVETGDILRGPPRKVKVSLHDPYATPICCCCMRNRSYNKLAKFTFKKHKQEPALQKYTSLETTMNVYRMAFEAHWKSSAMVLKVSVTQRRGRKVVIFGRIERLLHEMQHREADEFVLYVTETNFRIITKDHAPAVDEKTEEDTKITTTENKISVNKEETDYMISLRNAFKNKNGAAEKNVASPVVMKLPPQTPAVLAVETKFSYMTSNCSTRGKAPAAREQQSVPLHCKEHDEHKAEKKQEQIEDVKNTLPEKENKDDVKENGVQEGKESGLENEMQVLQEKADVEVESEGKDPTEDRDCNRGRISS